VRALPPVEVDASDLPRRIRCRLVLIELRDEPGTHVPLITSIAAGPDDRESRPRQ
jgi:hypothetical protein